MKCNNMWLYALQKNPQELKFFVLWKDYNYDILKENDKFEFAAIQLHICVYYRYPKPKGDVHYEQKLLSYDD